ncbi:MAG: DUF4142 domain-containing protein [Gemmatimonadetes bacterium]|nr:DUF4142 domain-containing protein [Gemmatimonadota bacterium]
MSYLGFKPTRPVAALCTAAMLSLGACSPAMMGTTSADMTANLTSVAAHQAEIEEAQLALSRAQGDGARQYAQRMISEHSPLLQRDAQMAMQMHHAAMGMSGSGMSASAGASMGGSDGPMVSADVRAMLMANPTTARLVQDHMQAMQRLQSAPAAGFDRMYMQRQVQAHQMVLSQMDALMPAVANPEVRAVMAQERPAVAAHLQMAQQMTASMASM